MFKQNKLAEDLKQKYLKQIKEDNSRNDPRFLNYFSMDFNQQMEVLLLADKLGQLFYEYSTHKTKRSGVKTINCPYTSSREPCVICSYGWDIYQTHGKEASAPWRRNSHQLSQCIVLNSPVVVPENEDGNLVKLFYLPFAIKELILDGMTNGTITDPTNHVLVIKKTHGPGSTQQNPRANYAKSFFRTEPAVVPPIFDEAFDAGLIKTYDLQAELPAPTTEAESVEWLTRALAAPEFSARASLPSNEETEPTTVEKVTTVSPEAHPVHDSPSVSTAQPIKQMTLQERLEARRRGQG